MAISLKGITVVLLGVRELKRSAAFYREKLGMAVRNEIPGFTFFDGGGVTLVLSEELAKHGSSLVGATEIVFGVESVRDAYQELKARGVMFTHEPRVITGTQWAANFVDPDGHKLSVFGPEK
jgi:catechol 2,3-dioxygenase-like lactoylglutathione lyase family enzyme